MNTKKIKIQRNKQYFFLSFFLFLNGMINSLTANPDSIYRIAQQAYMNQDYPKSIAGYESIILTYNKTNTHLYLNLGNAYFKTNDLPNAVLNYERCLKTDPGNEDAIYNLKIVKSKLQDKIEPIPTIFYLRWFEYIRNALSMNSWAILFMLMLFLISFSFILFFSLKNHLLKKLTLYIGITSLIFSILSVSMALSAYNIFSSKNHGIVFSSNVSVKSNPDYGSKGLFMIHAGTKVEYIEESEEWIKIRTDDNGEGWIPSTDVKTI